MTENKDIKLEKEAAQIEEELGEDHLVRMLQCLTSSSPEALQGLVKLHTECREIISKKPPIKTVTRMPKQSRTLSRETNGHMNTKVLTSSVQKSKAEKPRIMMTKRPHVLVPHNVQKNIAT
ncbi:hypothetical protein GCK32_017937 [Trichostrongylus colubriformis]|uniref:Uncharacterized protein n=1 Tax=Trichostrongylus colubriformis TaxID=6319 RepID=A0AAN8IL27_TRICO